MQSHDILLSFEHKGISYNCRLSQVAGAGNAALYHLNDDKNFYLGRLRWSDFTNSWVFDVTPKTKDLAELADYFGNHITRQQKTGL
jgi:hypothetical protein